MAYQSKQPKQKPHTTTEELRKRDVMALAYLLLDIYKDKKHKEHNDANTSK